MEDRPIMATRQRNKKQNILKVLKQKIKSFIK
jgi:hypothetical protein